MNTNIFENIVNNILNEYSADQRLPFDDDYFKNKNYLEQYTDWLEDFGKYGTLPPSKLDFWDEIKKAIKHIIDNKLHGRYDLGLEGYDENDILNQLLHIIGNNVHITNGNKIYVERKVTLSGFADDYDQSVFGKDPQYLFKHLVTSYQNNVGGCWCYKQGGADSYCSTTNGDSIILKGYIRNEDIDFVKTVLLNFHYKDEHEIRVKPNAKIELFNVMFNCKYKIPLKGHLIVTSTYFGNNSGYIGDYALVDDGFGNMNYIDRQGNIIKFDEFIKIINSKLSDGVKPEDLFNDVERLSNGLIKVQFQNKFSFIGKNNTLIYGGKYWFDYIDSFHQSFARIRMGKKWTLINSNGNLIGDGKYWFDYVGDFSQNLCYVKLGDKSSVINQDGKLVDDGNILFDSIQFFKNGFVKGNVGNKALIINQNGDIISKYQFDEVSEFSCGYSRIEYNGKCSFIKEDGTFIGNGNLWFDNAYSFRYNLASVNINDKWTFIDTDGNLIANGNLWFDYASSLRNGFARVEKGYKESFLCADGKLIGDGNLWFDYVEPFKDGYAKVQCNNNVYYIDKDGNFYDYNTKQPISNPLGKTNEHAIRLNHIINEAINFYLNKNII